jgi:hypothetical protein
LEHQAQQIDNDIETAKNQYHLNLNGFNFSDSPSKMQREFIDSQKIKSGYYDLETVEKLKQTDYNLFKEVTLHTT